MIENLNKAFESRIRLGIMSLLMVHDRVDFKLLKEQLGATDGNIASHTQALENLKYIKVTKEFVGKRPRTSYSATSMGKKAFRSHLDALETLLKL